MGGLIGRLLSFGRVTRNGAKTNDVKFNPGGGQNLTGQNFAPAGDDSFPLPTDYVFAVRCPQTGRLVVVGYVDPLNAGQANAGDKRIYGRDGDGAIVAELWIKNTGEAVLSNDNGSVTLGADGSILGQNSSGQFELEAAGDFVVNGVTIAANGDVTVPSSLTLNGKEIAEHTHSQANDSGGNTEQDTGPNN